MTLIGEEAVERASHRYVEGSYSVAGYGVKWRIHDTEENDAIVEEGFEDRAARDRRLHQLNIRAAISAHLAVLKGAGILLEWRPIETCPEREAHVFVYCPHAGRFQIQGWFCGPGADPKVCGATHWMPCPAPPAQKGDEG